MGLKEGERMKKKLKNTNKTTKWLNRISVTEIGACPKKIQYRYFYDLQREPDPFIFIQGKAVHALFDLIAKKPTLPQEPVYTKLIRENWSFHSLPSKYQKRLYQNLAIYEEKIREFFSKDRIGKQSFRSGIFNLEETLVAPLKDFNFNLNLPEDIVQQYEITGRLDFIGRIPQKKGRPPRYRLLEIKSGSKPRSRDFRQALVYQKLAKLTKYPRVGYYLIYLGENGPIRRTASPRSWDFKTGIKKIEELLERTIKEREILKKDPYHKFKWKPKVEECRVCPYRSSCRSTWTKIRHFFENLIKR